MKEWTKIVLYHKRRMLETIPLFYAYIFKALNIEWEAEAIEGRKYLLDGIRKDISRNEEKILTALAQDRWINIININQDNRVAMGFSKLSKEEMVNILTHPTWAEVFQKIRGLINATNDK